MELKKVLIGLVVGVFVSFLALLAGAYLPASVHYKITETYQFTTPEKTQVSLAVLLPKDGPYQTISRYQPQWGGTLQVKETEFIDILILRDTFSPGTHEATITYSASLRQGPVSWDSPVQSSHLEPESRIESDHPDIIAKALELGEGTARSDVYDIFNFVGDHLTLPSEDRINVCFTALETLQSGEGVCEDYSLLMVALLRARGIPARTVRGLVFPGWSISLPFVRSETRTWNHPGGAHAWVEVFTGEQWEIADPTWADSVLIGRDYFGESFGEHLSYGDGFLFDALYEKKMSLVRQEGNIIGAMSAPLKFVASATAEGVSITPMANVRKRWDGRWFNGLLVFTLILVGARILIWRFGKNRD